MAWSELYSHVGHRNPAARVQRMISMLEDSEQEDHCGQFCRRIISLDRSIAYAALADKFGSLIAAAFRETPLAGDKGAERYSMQSAVSALIAETGKESCYSKWVT